MAILAAETVAARGDLLALEIGFDIVPIGETSANGFITGRIVVAQKTQRLVREYDTETERLVSTGTDGVEIVTHPNRD